MRTAVLFILLCTVPVFTKAQSAKLLRLYEDNDLFTFKGSDKGYTNGTRIDVLYTRAKKQRRFLDKFMLHAGDSSTNTYSWGVMQTMVTPDDISIPDPDPSDYPYSGALFLVHALQAINPVEKYLVQTEWVAGVLGHHAFAEQTQKLIHKLTDSPEPEGWNTQFSTTVLVNLNVQMERALFQRRYLEVMYGGEVFIGTMMNGGTLHATIRVGKMPSYFSGYIPNYSASHANQKLLNYFVVRPSVELMLHNTLLEGSVFRRGLFNDNDSGEQHKYRLSSPHRHTVCVDIGWVVSYKTIGLSYTYKVVSSLVKGLPGNNIGNISMFITL